MISCSSYYLFAIVILQFIYISYRKTNTKIINTFRKCKWNVLKPKNIIMDNEYINTTKYINILNNLNIYYYLSFGSELAAYRDGHKKKNDHDVDFNIPIWKNYDIFHCNKIVEINDTVFKNRNVHLNDRYTICGKNRTFYLMKFQEYIMIKWKKYNVKSDIKSLSIHVYLNYSPFSFPLHYDFWICLSNEYVYRTLDLCITPFQNTISIISSNPHLHLKLLYGNYSIVKNMAASSGIPIRSPNIR